MSTRRNLQRYVAGVFFIYLFSEWCVSAVTWQLGTEGEMNCRRQKEEANCQKESNSKLSKAERSDSDCQRQNEVITN
jgi:hypothetical protein